MIYDDKIVRVLFLTNVIKTVIKGELDYGLVFKRVQDLQAAAIDIPTIELLKNVFDTTGQQDQITNIDLVLNKFESIEQLDNAVYSLVKALEDLITPADQANISSALSKYDSVAQSDSKVYTLLKNLQDTASQIDQMTRGVNLVKTETPSGQDQLVDIKSSLAKYDSVAPSESAKLTTSLPKIESLTSQDVFSRVVAYQRVFTELVTAADALGSLVFVNEENDAVVAQPVNIEDDPELAIAKAVPTDNAPATDTATINSAKQVGTDTYSTTDNSILSTDKYTIDSQSTLEQGFIFNEIYVEMSYFLEDFLGNKVGSF